MNRVLACYIFLFVQVLPGFGQAVQIQSINHQGELRVEGPTNAVLYQVEWASQVNGPWHSFDDPALHAIPPGGTNTVEAVVPLQFRVVAEVHADYLVVDLSAGPAAAQYPVSGLSGVPPGGWTDEYKTDKMVFRLIPAGTYIRGTPTGEVSRISTEYQHPVTISKPFYMGVFEVTQHQWERVMGTWPSFFSNPSFRSTRPVEQVTFFQIVGAAGSWWPETSEVDPGSFMGRLQARTGMLFHLPTEGEWEYAGRAGSTAALTSGQDIVEFETDPNLALLGRYRGNNDLNQVAAGGDLTNGTTAVGSYLPNAWGLYDIHGNVEELVADIQKTYPSDGSALTDPRGGSFNFDGLTFRVARGGGYGNTAGNCRLGYRGFSVGPGSFQGFRAVARIYPDRQP